MTQITAEAADVEITGVHPSLNHHFTAAEGVAS